jgi:hypothetical protein
MTFESWKVRPDHPLSGRQTYKVIEVVSVTEVDLVVRTLASIKELKAEEPKKMAEEEVSAGEVVQPVESQLVEEPSVVASPEPGIEPQLETSAEGVPSSGSSTPEVVEVAHPVIPFQFDPNGALKKSRFKFGRSHRFHESCKASII